MRPTDTPLRPTNARPTPSTSAARVPARGHHYARRPDRAGHHAVTPTPESRIDDRSVAAVLAAAVGLVANNYVKGSAPGVWMTAFEPLADAEFARLAWWTVSNLVFTGLLPVAVARWAGWTLRDMGFGLGSLKRHAAWYAGAALVMIPLVVLASQLPAFQRTYPFYGPTQDPAYVRWLFAWWVLYGLQFVAVEGLFRGLLAVGVARRMRLSSLAAAALATIPYAMIHFGKPAAESFGALVAGMALSWLAMRSRSIWGGVGLHVTVALTMDIAVLHHLGVW